MGGYRRDRLEGRTSEHELRQQHTTFLDYEGEKGRGGGGEEEAARPEEAKDDEGIKRASLWYLLTLARV